MQLHRHLPVLLLATAGISASVVAWRLASSYEEGRARLRAATSFEQAVGAVFASLEREVGAQVAPIPALAAFYASSEVVTAEEFETFTAPFLLERGGLLALEWAPRVSPEQPQDLAERLAAVGGPAGLQVVEPDPAGSLRPAEPRRAWFPVVLVAPLDGNEAALGFDLGSTRERRTALERAVDTGQPQATALLTLVQQPDHAGGFLVVAPVYDKGRDIASVEARRAAADGVVVGVYRLDELVRTATSTGPAAGGQAGEIDLYLYAADGAPARLPLHVQGAVARREGSPALTLQDALIGVHAAHRVQVAGLDWLVVARPFHTQALEVPVALPWTVLLAGLALTGSACLGILVLSSRAETVTRLVEARTAQLAATTRELAERERHLRAIVDNTVDGIVLIDQDGRIRSVNPAIVRMFGYRPEELLGQPTSILMPSPHNGRHEEYVRSYRGSRQSTVVGTLRELTGARADGSLFPLELSVSEVADEEGRAFLGVVRDISERKAIERMKDEFISTVSHELRTPLTSMLGSLELVRDGMLGPLPDQVHRMVDVAYDSGERLVRLINDILDMERVGTGGLTLSRGVIDGTDLLEQAASANRGFADLHGVVLARELPPESVYVLGDRDRLMQVLTNLIGNAVKFSPAGGRVLLTLSRDGPGAAVFAVTDQGPGIPEDFWPRVFTPFSQADASDRRAEGGTGLGLSIAKAIVEAHGGAIWFETSDGGGTTFLFRLAVASGPATDGAPA